MALVFLGASAPGVAPVTPIFDETFDNNYAEYSGIQLGQVYFIGDGRRDNNGMQIVVDAPVGATRLFLGFADGASFVGVPWTVGGTPDNDNTGSFLVDVQLLPEPGTIMLMGFGLFGLALLHKRRFA